MILWSGFTSEPRDKLNPFYLFFHSVYKQQILRGDALPLGAVTRKIL